MRILTDDERRLVEHLAHLAGITVEANLLLAEPMNDGGMGGLRFASATETPRLGAEAAAIAFEDEDGVLVHAALLLDQEGSLFELDMWKVDFATLLRWPSAADLDRIQGI